MNYYYDLPMELRALIAKEAALKMIKELPKRKEYQVHSRQGVYGRYYKVVNKYGMVERRINICQAFQAELVIRWRFMTADWQVE